MDELTGFDILLTDSANKEKVDSSIAARNSVIIHSRDWDWCLQRQYPPQCSQLGLGHILPMIAESGRSERINSFRKKIFNAHANRSFIQSVAKRNGVEMDGLS